MNTREQAKQWLRKNHPSENISSIRTSKYYPEKDIWFLTFPISFFDAGKPGNLIILLQHKNDPEQFHFLKVPFSFFRKNQKKFDIRSSGDEFDLHISGKKRNWLFCERSNNISFETYEQYA